MKILTRFAVLVVVIVVLGALVIFMMYETKNWETLVITEDVRASTGESYIGLSDGITEYELAGPDSGQVVVLLAGATVPFYIWDGTFESLVASGFRVLRYNYYGRGFSDRPNVLYDRALFERQLQDILESLNLETPVDLVALSMGGLVAAAYAATYPEHIRRIVFIDPAYRSYPPPGVPEWLAGLLFVLSGQDAAADGQLVDFHEPEKFPDWVARYKVQMQYEGFRRARISSFFHFLPMDHMANFRALGLTEIPMFLVWGKHDVTIPFAESRVVRDATKADFLVVDSAAHLPHLEQPDIVNPAIIEFLSGSDGSTE